MTLAIDHRTCLLTNFEQHRVKDSEQGVRGWVIFDVNLPLLADMLSGGGVVALKC